MKERFFQHGGNAEVVRQDLVREQGIDMSLRTVERAVAPVPAAADGRGEGDGAVRDSARASAAD